MSLKQRMARYLVNKQISILTRPHGQKSIKTRADGKEPLGHLRSFSALLKVPAGRRSCASGISELSLFNGKEPFGHLRSFSAVLKVPLAAVHVPAEATQLPFFQWQKALWSPSIFLFAAERARWAPLMCQRKLRSSHFSMAKSPLGP